MRNAKEIDLLTFPPVHWTDSFQMISPSELWTMLVRREIGFVSIHIEKGYTKTAEYKAETHAAERAIQLVQDAVQNGALVAYVQAQDDHQIYRVPNTFWDRSKAIEGELSDTLFCWDNSDDAPIRFHDAPVFFRWDHAKAWMETLQSTPNFQGRFAPYLKEMHAAITGPSRQTMNAAALAQVDAVKRDEVSKSDDVQSICSMLRKEYRQQAGG